MEKIAPLRTSFKASYPLPSSKSLCPGKTEIDVSLLGAPRKIDGKKPVINWEVEMLAIKTAKISGLKNVNVKKIGKRLLMFIPGTNPVKIPTKIPEKIARK